MGLEYTSFDYIAETCVAHQRVTKHCSTFKHYIGTAKVLYRVWQGLLNVLPFPTYYTAIEDKGLLPGDEPRLE